MNWKTSSLKLSEVLLLWILFQDKNSSENDKDTFHKIKSFGLAIRPIKNILKSIINCNTFFAF